LEQTTTLPANIALNLVDTLVVNLTTIIMKDEYEQKGRALTVLYDLLENNPSVKKRYNPTKTIISKLDLG
jgi:hypothetical protein